MFCSSSAASYLIWRSILLIVFVIVILIFLLLLWCKGINIVVGLQVIIVEIIEEEM